ncbi:MAG TPA: molybdenum cofactor biosynthesis protein MoaE [Gammaproteobacteria bacterium]|nr:molybdenum cofactor biosynthesis protein MoaE [Gammaproteobacteria bacterium]
MTISVRNTPFDPWTELRQYQDKMLTQYGKYGATASFVGTLRDTNLGTDVQGMTLEHYPGMTEKSLQHIADEARQHWAILDILIIHRYGELAPNEPIMLAAVWAEHRAAAFDACRFIVEELKHRAPFWKCEDLATHKRWVEQNTLK